TREDLRSYRARERAPLRGHYRDCEILTMPPPSSGGVALLEMLNMLEPFDLAALGRNSAARSHLFAEVMRRAFRDRTEFLGDPDFVDVPVSGLTEKSYARHRMQDFAPQKATVSRELNAGRPRNEATETTHFSVVDAEGNAVSNTYTLNGAYGC